MGILDNLGGQAHDIMDDPDKKSQIEQMARERNISIEEAKAHFTQNKDS